MRMTRSQRRRSRIDFSRLASLQPQPVKRGKLGQISLAFVPRHTVHMKCIRVAVRALASEGGAARCDEMAFAKAKSPVGTAIDGSSCSESPGEVANYRNT